MDFGCRFHLASQSSYLVWKADSKSTENRFMGVLLIIEGIKSAFLLPDAFPYDSDWEWLWDYLWVFKIEVFFYAHTAAIPAVSLPTDLLSN